MVVRAEFHVADRRLLPQRRLTDMMGSPSQQPRVHADRVVVVFARKQREALPGDVVVLHKSTGQETVMKSGFVAPPSVPRRRHMERAHAASGDRAMPDHVRKALW